MEETVLIESSYKETSSFRCDTLNATHRIAVYSALWELQANVMKAIGGDGIRVTFIPQPASCCQKPQKQRSSPVSCCFSEVQNIFASWDEIDWENQRRTLRVSTSTFKNHIPYYLMLKVSKLATE